jgi:putative membrane protein
VTRLMLSGAFAALGLWVASVLFPNLYFAGPGTLVLAGLLLGCANAVLRPVLVILTLPLTLVTLGLFLLVINAAMVALVAWVLPGMAVHGFLTAVLTAVTVSIVSFIGHALLRT